MTDNDLTPAVSAKSDRQRLLQHALVCELGGDLDCALAMIRRLRDLGADQPRWCDRRIA